jgi:hypothetical protein
MRHYLKQNASTFAFIGNGAVSQRAHTRPSIVNGSCDSDAYYTRRRPIPDPTVDTNHADDLPPWWDSQQPFLPGEVAKNGTPPRETTGTYGPDNPSGTGYFVGYVDAPDENTADDYPPTWGQTGYAWINLGNGSFTGTYYPNWPSGQGSQGLNDYQDPTVDGVKWVEYQDSTIDTNHADDHRRTPREYVPARTWTCRAEWRVGYAYHNRTVCVLYVCETERVRDEVDCTSALRAHGVRHVRVTGNRLRCTRYSG